MNLFKKVLFVFILLMGLFFVACGEEEKEDNKTNEDNKQEEQNPEEKKEFAVTFVVNGEETEVKVKDGEKVTKPADPVKEGYKFLGWYVGEVEYDFGAVTSDVTVTAKFEEVKPEVKEFTVKFVVDGEATEVKVKEGEKVAKPADPVKDGYEFLGWFVGDEAYDFEAVVTTDLELVAKFEEVKLGYLTPDELLVVVSKAVNDYSDSLNGSFKIDLVNDEEVKSIVLKYNYADKENVESLEYVVSGTVSTHIYVKNEMVYISSNDVKSQEELTSSSSDLLINKYGAKSLLVPALKFYNEVAFYNALEYVEETENGSKYSLKLANYSGNSINVVGKESVEVFVKAAEGEVTAIEIVSTSLDKVSKVKVEFNGLDKAEITYPDGLENYGE